MIEISMEGCLTRRNKWKSNHVPLLVAVVFAVVFAVVVFCVLTFINEPDSITIQGEEHLLRKIREAADEECSSNETVTSQGGKLTSPGFPGQHPSNQNCRWLLTAPDESNIVLIIKSLNLEMDHSCSLDFLQVYLGASTLAPSLDRMCGTIKDKVIVTNSSKVLLVFHSDPSYEEEGFSIEYYLQSSEDCQATLTELSGTVSSPQFPNNYPDNSDCWTLISVDEDKQILFQFKSLDLEYDDNCTYDFVEVFDGSSRAAPSLGKVCSSNQKLLLHSTKNTLLIYFHSDHLVNKKGFFAQYTTIAAVENKDIEDVGDCELESEERNGTMASPNYPQNYPSNAHCNILLTAPLNNVITINFEVIVLEIEPNCTYDYVEISDGLMKGAEKKKYCGKLSEGRQFTSTGNIVFIKFESDDFAEFSGFKLSYRFHSPSEESQPKKDNETDKDTVDSPTEGQLHPPSTEKFFLEKPQNATLQIGESHMLECAVIDPVAKIRWLKDDQFLGGNTPLQGLKLVANNTLWIQSMTKKLSGIYTCAAVTPEETHLAVARISLKNDPKPDESSCSIVLRKIPRDSSFTEGEFAHMECLAAGNQVQTHWEKDGKILETKDHITVLRTGFLFLDQVTLDDDGIYTCVVTDVISNCNKRVSVRLTVNGRAKLQEVCGQPKVGKPSADKPRLDHGKIVGGHDTSKGAYPWQVMLWEPSLKSFCGGSLVNERWIVTAAHCFVNYKGLRWNEVVIKLGKYNRETKEPEEFITAIAEASAIVIHPAYNKETFDNDIALVRLRDHVTFTDYILPICLGIRETYEDLMDGHAMTMGTVTGWGKLKEYGGSPKFLQEIKLPLVNQKTCVNSTRFSVTRNMFCAGYSQEIVGDACHGDSGGPLIVEKGNKWLLVGIVSWGEGCGKANKYGFYTKVMNYLPWITGIMKS